MTKRTIYQRIMRAAELGTGVRLSKDDARALAQDHAVRASAETDDKVAADDRAKRRAA